MWELKLNTDMKHARARAEALFKNKPRQPDDGITTAAALAERQAVEAKTARLRALRLAEEAKRVEPRPKRRPKVRANESQAFRIKAEEYARIADAAADPEAKKRYKEFSERCRNLAQAASE